MSFRVYGLELGFGALKLGSCETDIGFGLQVVPSRDVYRLERGM